MFLAWHSYALIVLLGLGGLPEHEFLMHVLGNKAFSIVYQEVQIAAFVLMLIVSLLPVGSSPVRRRPFR